MTEPAEPTEDEVYASYFTKPVSAPLSADDEDTYRLYYPDPQQD